MAGPGPLASSIAGPDGIVVDVGGGLYFAETTHAPDSPRRTGHKTGFITTVWATARSGEGTTARISKHGRRFHPADDIELD